MCVCENFAKNTCGTAGSISAARSAEMLSSIARGRKYFLHFFFVIALMTAPPIFLSSPCLVIGMPVFREMPCLTFVMPSALCVPYLRMKIVIEYAYELMLEFVKLLHHLFGNQLFSCFLASKIILCSFDFTLYAFNMTVVSSRMIDFGFSVIRF